MSLDHSYFIAEYLGVGSHLSLDHAYFIAEYLGVRVPHVFGPFLLYC